MWKCLNGSVSSTTLPCIIPLRFPSRKHNKNITLSPVSSALTITEFDPCCSVWQHRASSIYKDTASVMGGPFLQLLIQWRFINRYFTKQLPLHNSSVARHPATTPPPQHTTEPIHMLPKFLQSMRQWFSPCNSKGGRWQNLSHILIYRATEKLQLCRTLHFSSRMLGLSPPPPQGQITLAFRKVARLNYWHIYFQT
jgi:hypothetical protein